MAPLSVRITTVTGQPRPQGFSLKKWVGPGKGPGIKSID